MISIALRSLIRCCNGEEEMRGESKRGLIPLFEIGEKMRRTSVNGGTCIIYVDWVGFIGGGRAV
jgi:hypothetical protein